MYHFFRQNPLIRPALFFLSGIAIQQTGSSPAPPLAAATLISFACIRCRGVPGISFLFPFIFLILGYTHSFYSQASIRPFARQLEKYRHSLVTAETYPEEKNNFYKFRGRCLYVKDSCGPAPASEEPVLFFLEKDSAAAKLKPGDRILLSGSWTTIAPPGNPAAFNYKKYLGRQNIRYQLFVRNAGWKKTGGPESFSLLYLTRSWQKSMTEQLERSIPDPDVAAISKAILLGDTHDLSYEVKSSFSLTGTMHVLAVSGMHVVVLFLLFNLLMKPIRNSRVRSLLLLLILWLYAMLTGLSPSVLRSVVMFSFMLIGQELGRRASAYNSLSLAALVLCAAEPGMLFQVGFQLSFLAVLGIVFFYPYLQRVFPAKEKWKKYLVELLGMSLAAQLITFPLTLYYFHQFPNYFLLSNFFVVPLSNPILVLSLAVLAFSQVPYISDLTCWSLTAITKLTLLVNDAVAALPYSSSAGIPFSLAECLVCYWLIISASAWLMLKKNGWLRSVLYCLIALAGIPVWHHIRNQRSSQLTIYQVKGRTCIEIRHKNTLFFYGDPTEEEKAFLINPWLMQRGFSGNAPWKIRTAEAGTFGGGKRSGQSAGTCRNRYGDHQ
jgi:competence protein ComEC